MTTLLLLLLASEGAPSCYFVTHMDLQLTDKATKQSLSVPPNDAVQGKNLLMRGPGGFPSQRFHMRAYNAANTYIIHAQSGFYVLTMANSPKVHLGANTGNAYSFWNVNFNGRGQYLIKNAQNGLYLTAAKDVPLNKACSGQAFLSKLEPNNTFQEWIIHEHYELEKELPEVNCT